MKRKILFLFLFFALISFFYSGYKTEMCNRNQGFKKYVKIDEKYNVNYHSGYDDDHIFEIICREIKIN